MPAVGYMTTAEQNGSAWNWNTVPTERRRHIWRDMWWMDSKWRSSGRGLSEAYRSQTDAEQLKRTYQEGRRDFDGNDLSGLDLRGRSLPGINLRKANLTSTNLTECDLRGADMQDSNLEGCILRRANMHSANLYPSRLTFIDGVEATLTHVRMRLVNARCKHFPYCFRSIRSVSSESAVRRGNRARYVRM
jgi:hypothetical protein